MREMLKVLEKNYRGPVDTEFVLRIDERETGQPQVTITLLQCRPQSQIKESIVRLPQTLFPEDVIFSTRRMVPRGAVEGICYVVFVAPEGYYALATTNEREELARAVSRLNLRLKDETFICVGPGRWGTANTDLGVHVGYSDIYNTRSLIEMAGAGVGAAPEPSFGTHFFQDLVESNIYPLAIYLDDEDVIFQRDFFYKTENQLARLLPNDAWLSSALRVIAVSDYRSGWHMDLVMDDDQGRAVAFLAPD
jgi:hypothetical protein